MEPGRPGAKGNLAPLTLMIVGVFIAGLAAGLSRLALAKYMRDDLGTSMLVASSLTTWFMAARAVSSMISGIGAAASKRLWRLFMTAPLVGIAIIVYIISRIRDPFTILALNAAWGFLAGLIWPQAQTVTSMLGGSKSGTAIAVYFTVGSFGISAGNYLYGVLPYDNAGVVMVSSLAYLVSALFIGAVSLLAPPPTVEKRRRGDGLREVLRIGGLAVWILVAAFAAGYSAGMLKEFLYLYLGEVYGLTREELAEFLALAGVLAVVVSFMVGPLADLLGTGPVLAGILALGVAGNLALGSGAGVGAALAGLVLAQSSTRSSMPLTRNAAAFQHEYAVALVGASNTLSSLGQMTGPLVAGKIYETFHGTLVAGVPGESLPFVTSALLMALVLLSYPIAVRAHRPSPGSG